MQVETSMTDMVEWKWIDQRKDAGEDIDDWYGWKENNSCSRDTLDVWKLTDYHYKYRNEIHHDEEKATS